MTAIRRTSFGWAALSCSLLLLACGCSDSNKCIFFSAGFQGIGHLGTTSPDSSAPWSVAEDGGVVGGSADKHTAGATTFNPGTAGVYWSEPGEFSFWKTGAGTGIEKLSLCSPPDLVDPVRGTARGIAPGGRDAVGSVSCNGVDKPARFNHTTMVLLPFPASPGFVSGEAVGMTNLAMPTLVAGTLSPSNDLFNDHVPATAVAWTDDKSGTGFVAHPLAPPAPETTSSRAYAVRGGPSGFTGLIAGVAYDEVAGMAGSSIPCAWMFIKDASGLPWRGIWRTIALRDDTGAVTNGAATAASTNGKLVFGHILKGGVVVPCQWDVTGGLPTASAAVLPALAGSAATYVSGTGQDGTLSVGYAEVLGKPVAIAFTASKASDIKEELNKWIAGTVPADWELLEATSISPGAEDQFSTLNLFQLRIAGRGLHAGVPEGWVLHVKREQLKGIVCRFPGAPELISWFRKWKRWPPIITKPRPADSANR